jgi:hypothetical protein
MLTARDYFDQTPYLTVGSDIEVAADGDKCTVSVKIAYDFEAGSKFLVLYIPDNSHADAIFAFVMSNVNDLIWKADKDLEVISGLAGHEEEIKKTDLAFTGHVIVWTPSILDRERWTHIGSQMRSGGFLLRVRDGRYVARRASFLGPVAFISHDSRDKEDFVRPLATSLQRSLCPLWYDEFSLLPGNSLRENIEKGLKTCGKCVLVLSPNFFANEGWGRREFDTIYTREIIEKNRVIVPIWLNVSAKEVYEYSPILLNTLGIQATVGIEEVARQVMRALDYRPPLRAEEDANSTK